MIQFISPLPSYSLSAPSSLAIFRCFLVFLLYVPLSWVKCSGKQTLRWSQEDKKFIGEQYLGRQKRRKQDCVEGMLDSDAKPTRSIPVKVTNHSSLLGNISVFVLTENWLPGKSLSKPGQLVTQHQPNGKLGSKECLVEESYLGWKWPVPCITTLLSYWLGPPKKSVNSVTIWFSVQ